MDFFMCILALLAGCGVFMLGMNLMSHGLETICGSSFKKTLGKVVNNRWSGLGLGAGVTAIIQSSSATTVMVIGLINAGVLTIFQASSIIMGANIGTTITGIIASFSSIKVSKYLATLAFVGVFMTMFVKSDKAKNIGNILTGLGIIFVGLDLMSKAFTNEEVLNTFMSMFAAIDFPLVLILLGTALTAIIQSSSAVTGIVIIMAGQGAISLEASLFIVLGSNIGTCVTAILSSIGANRNAKRAALFHLLFNVIGTIVFATFIWIFKGPIVNFLDSLPINIQFKVSLFHVVFNVVTALLLIPFLKPLVELTGKMVGEPKDKKAKILKHIDNRLLDVPYVAAIQAKEEIIEMYGLANTNFQSAFKALRYKVFDDVKSSSIIEDDIDYLNNAISKYLVAISSKCRDDHKTSQYVGEYFHVINDIERIGDYATDLIELAEKLDRDGQEFGETAKEGLSQMYGKLEELFPLALDAFVNRSGTQFNNIDRIEDEMDTLKTTLVSSHYVRIQNDECNSDLTGPYTTIVIILERVADHLVNIAYSIKNPTGDQKEKALS